MSDATVDDLLDLEPESVTQDEVDLEVVQEALRDETGLVRDQAADILLTFANTDPESALPAIPEIAVAIDSDHVNVTNKAVSTAMLVGEDHIDAIEPLVEPLVHCLYDEIPRTQAFAAKALQPVAKEHPEWLVDHVEVLLSVITADLDDPTEGMPDDVMGGSETTEQFQKVAEEEKKQQFLARSVAANLLYEAVEVDTAVGRSHVDELVAAIGESDGTVTAAVVDTLAAIGEADPIAIEDAVPSLVDLLENPSEEIQARSVKALGFSGDERAIDPLRELAEDSKAGEDLRELATQTADWIDNETHN